MLEFLVLNQYQTEIAEGLQKAIRKMGEGDVLHEAVKYALLNGGKRLRPVLALAIAESLLSKKGAKAGPLILPAALAVEYFHTASLVADDLPCMDDDDLRRSKPSVHKVYGESLALLASYALIASGFAALAEVTRNLMQSSLPHASNAAFLGILALENATFNTGLQGATGGQLLDLYPPDLSLSTLREVVQKKTSSLLKLLLSWVGSLAAAIPSCFRK